MFGIGGSRSVFYVNVILFYKYKGRTICSDSYHPKGDAATQYNFEPYFNDKKPRLEPNKSFDLCSAIFDLKLSNPVVVGVFTLVTFDYKSQKSIVLTDNIKSNFLPF